MTLEEVRALQAHGSNVGGRVGGEGSGGKGRLLDSREGI